jgi:hypothetical protein
MLYKNRVILICCLGIMKDDLPLYKSWSSAYVVVKQSNTNMLPLYLCMIKDNILYHCTV